jgi:hypothetical protein
VSAGALARLALGDFRDRVRRPAYAVTLATAVGLGYLAVPQAQSRLVIMQLGDYRGIYNSAYVGMVTALAGVLWLTLAGFYVVRNTIARDESTHVGQLLAATPLRTSAYLAGKFLSNVMVLASMLGVLAVTALVMQEARGESSTIAPVALLSPFVLIALPVMAVTAAAALLFEVVPVLRTGLGNVIWFFVWMVVAIAGQAPGAPLGGLGVHSVAQSMGATMIAQHIDVSNEQFSLGLTYLDHPLHTFVWNGFTPSGGFLLERLALVLLAVVLALVPTLWFGRFDPARAAMRRERQRAQALGAENAAPPIPVDYTPSRVMTLQALPRSEAAPGLSLGRLLIGELRILLQGVQWWWWAGAAAIMVAGFLAPIASVPRLVLPLCWVWPILIWSRLGTQRYEYGVQALLGAYPMARRRLLAEWAAGFALTVVVAVVAVLRMAMAANWHGVSAWTAGALFIPSFALALGTLSRTHRLFQAIYLPLWYGAVNGVPVLDFMGALQTNGHSAGPSPLAITVLSAVMVAIVFVVGGLRRQARA